MKKLINILMLSCKKATELIDKKSVTELSLSEKLILNVHTGVCNACATYQKQNKILDNFLNKHISMKDESKIPQFSNHELKQRIISKL